MPRKHFLSALLAGLAVLGPALAQTDSANFTVRAVGGADIRSSAPAAGAGASPIGALPLWSGWTYHNTGTRALHIQISAVGITCHHWRAHTPAGIVEGLDNCKRSSSSGNFFLAPGQTFHFANHGTPGAHMTVTAMASGVSGWEATGLRAPVHHHPRHQMTAHWHQPCPESWVGPAISGHIEMARYRDLIQYNYGPREHGGEYAIELNNTCNYGWSAG